MRYLVWVATSRHDEMRCAFSTSRKRIARAVVKRLKQEGWMVWLTEEPTPKATLVFGENEKGAATSGEWQEKT